MENEKKTFKKKVKEFWDRNFDKIMYVGSVIGVIGSSYLIYRSGKTKGYYQGIKDTCDVSLGHYDTENLTDEEFKVKDLLILYKNGYVLKEFKTIHKDKLPDNMKSE